MANRCAEQGMFGLYDDDMVKKIGLKKALLDTAKHLEFGLTQVSGSERDSREMEVRRLRTKAAGV